VCFYVEITSDKIMTEKNT